MKINNIPFFNNDFNLNSSLIPKVNKSLFPFVDVSIKASTLNLNISFYELTKKDIFIDYTNNFLVLKISFSSPPSNETFKIRRNFYYKNLDFYKYKSKEMKGIVFLKIPFVS